MFLPPSSEKAQLTPLPKKLPNKITEKAVFFVQNQALPAGWSVLRLSLGLGGIFTVFGSSTALAESGFQDADLTDSITATPSLPALDVDAKANRKSTNVKNTDIEGHNGDRTTIKTGHPQPRLWETARSSSPTPSPTELSFHPAPLLTDMGPLTRTLTSHGAIAHNHSQHFAQQRARQAEPQPKFSTGSTPRDAPAPTQAAAGETPARADIPLDRPPLNIAKLSGQVTLSALSQPATGHHVTAGSAGEAADHAEISLEALIAGSLVAGNPSDKALIASNLITEEIANSTEGIPPEIEGFPDSSEQEALPIGPDIGSNVLPNELAPLESENAQGENIQGENIQGEDIQSNELGTLRVQPTRSRASEELGILRLMQTAQAPPPPPKPPISFLTGRLGFFSSGNAFRSNPRIDESIYQSGLAYYLFPKLSDRTSLYAIAETNLARYDQFQSVNYNELEVQLGVRQRLLPRTYAQVGWRNQRLYSPGYREKLFSVNYIDTMVSHRSILNSKTWVDGFYQARLGFANPDTASRFRQTFTVSLNYGATRDLRTSLLYQLDFDDYTQVSRYDTYQQVLGIVSYNLTPESRISVFGGTRFGRSSSPGVNLDDTFYGAGLNVSVPLF